MKKLLLALAVTASLSFLSGNASFAQTESYYTDLGCKALYLEATSSKVKIFYGNGMTEEVSGKPDMLIITLTNTFLKSGYTLASVNNKMINGEQQPGYLFFVRKEEK